MSRYRIVSHDDAGPCAACGYPVHEHFLEGANGGRMLGCRTVRYRVELREAAKRDLHRPIRLVQTRHGRRVR